MIRQKINQSRILNLNQFTCLLWGRGLSDTHSIVDDVDLQVDDSFGRAGQLFIFQQVALLLSISDLTSQRTIPLRCLKI